MQNIIIDTCVFFQMLPYNDRFQREGRSGVEQLLANRKSIAQMYKESNKKNDIGNYHNAKNSCSIGELYLKALDGEYSLNIAATSFNEIMNHVAKEGEAVVKTGFKKFAPERVMSLAEKCTLISIKDERAMQYVRGLGRTFRRPLEENDPTQAMTEDINSSGTYGDSYIAATAMLAGYILVTQNTKDFIGHKNKRNNTHNDLIRQHLKRSSDKYSRLVSDALPYTVEELLDGKAIMPSRPSTIVKIERSENSNPLFDAELEIRAQ